MTAALPAEVDIAASADAPTDTCLFLPPQALPEVRLPSRLIIEGSGGWRLVGAKRVPGADDESTVRVSLALVEALFPGLDGEQAEALVRKASWKDVRSTIGRTAKRRVLAALIVLLGAIGVAAASVATLDLPTWLIVVILVLAFLAAAITAWRETHDVVTPSCK
jgi:hypothetical protein